MIDKDKLDALAELKEANSADALSLREENQNLHQRLQGFETDLDVQRSMLNTTLLEKDKIQKSLSEQKDHVHEAEKGSAELKATLDMVRAASDGRDEGAREALEQHAIQLQGKIEQGRERLAKRTEVGSILKQCDGDNDESFSSLNPLCFNDFSNDSDFDAAYQEAECGDQGSPTPTASSSGQ